MILLKKIRNLNEGIKNGTTVKYIFYKICGASFLTVKWLMMRCLVRTFFVTIFLVSLDRPNIIRRYVMLVTYTIPDLLVQ